MNEALLLPTVVILLAGAAYLAFWPRRRDVDSLPSAIRPASELQREFGLYAENRPILHLDPDKVPTKLRDLVPLAETWGIADDIVRFDLAQKASAAARAELLTGLRDRLDEIEQWLSSRPADVELSEEAAAFMYLLCAYDEVRPYESA